MNSGMSPRTRPDSYQDTTCKHHVDPPHLDLSIAQRAIRLMPFPLSSYMLNIYIERCHRTPMDRDSKRTPLETGVKTDSSALRFEKDDRGKPKPAPPSPFAPPQPMKEDEHRPCKHPKRVTRRSITRS